MSLSETHGASSVVLMACAPSTHLDSHPAPRRQLMIVLTGYWFCTASDGGRRFGPGEMLLAADTQGAGHEATTAEAGVVVAAVAIG